MEQRPVWKGLRLILTILICQLALILAMSATWGYLRSALAGYSSLYGGGIYMIPQLLFIICALKREINSGGAGLVLWDFYVGSGVKLISTIALFVVVFKYLEADHFPLYMTYVLSLFFQWVITIVFNNRY